MKCDCRLEPFILQLYAKGTVESDTNLCLQSDFESNQQKAHTCPGLCSCGCTNYGNDSFMYVDCNSKNLSVVPQFLRSSFTQREVSINRISCCNLSVSFYRLPFFLKLENLPKGVVEKKIPYILTAKIVPEKNENKDLIGNCMLF